ncbi:hypothetical protein PQX77_008890, partial [Marasmius sp. AFHP31]
MVAGFTELAPIPTLMNELVTETGKGDGDGDTDDKMYYFCSFGEMVGCDNKDWNMNG